MGFKNIFLTKLGGKIDVGFQTFNLYRGNQSRHSLLA